MKVVKILAVVFGALLVLTGAGLLVGASLVGTGQTALDRQLSDSRLAGPVQGEVTAVDQGSLVTVEYTDKLGESHTGHGPDASSPPPQVGDTVSLYYSTDDPEQIIVYELPGGSLESIGSSLRTAGIICLVVGGLLLVGGILGLVLGRKSTPAVTAGWPYPGGPPNQPPPGYPTQPYQNQPPPGYPGQPYQNQPPPGYPGQPYQNQPPATYSGPQYGQQPPPAPPQPPPGQQQYPGQPPVQQPPADYPPPQQ
jgi:hypothetical protein